MENGIPATSSTKRAGSKEEGFWRTARQTVLRVCNTSITDLEYFTRKHSRGCPSERLATLLNCTRLCCSASNWRRSKCASGFTRLDHRRGCRKPLSFWRRGG